MTVSMYGIADIVTEMLSEFDGSKRKLPVFAHSATDITGKILSDFSAEQFRLIPTADDDDNKIASHLGAESPLMWITPLVGRESINEVTELMPTEGSKVDGSLIVLLPMSVLTGSAWDKFRRRLFSLWQPEIVCDVMGDGGKTRIRFGLLLLKPSRPAAPLVTKFFKFSMEKEAVSHAEFEDFKRLLRMKGGQTIHGFIIRGATFDDGPIHFDAFDPKLVKMRRELADFGSALRLGDLYKVVMSGYRNPSLNRNDPDPSAEGLRNVRVLRGRDILRNGTILEMDEEDEAALAQVPLRHQLKLGDFVVRTMFAERPTEGLVFAEVTAVDLPAAAGPGVLVLRANEPVSEVPRDFVLSYLRSPRCLELSLFDSLHGHLRLSSKSLSSLLIPYPDEEMITTLTHLREVKHKMLGWKEEADALLNSVFDDQSAKLARQRILREGRLLRQRANEADSLTTLSGRVRKQFPLPLAYRWRKMETDLSNGSSRDGYDSILGFFEVLTAYLAQVAAAMAFHAGIRLQEMDDVAKKLSSQRGGTTLGDWQAILTSTKSKKFRSLDEDIALGEIRDALGPDVYEASRWLTNARNDKSHDRPVDDVQLPKAIETAKFYLDQIMESLSFLPDLSLRFVSDFQWDDLTKEGQVYYEELIGDHPAIASASGTTIEILEKGSLYIVDALDRWHRIRPFLIRERCTECKTWSTFYIDRIHDSDVKLKSLEHGHVITANTQVVKALQTVGYLM